MTRHEVDMFIGQTPCVCGAIDTWHPLCYSGKSKEQIDKEYARAYRLARRQIYASLAKTQRDVIAKAQEKGID